MPVLLKPLPPTDGISVIDDFDLSDRMGAVNIPYGDQTVSFTALEALTDYYFAIYPYTNSGSNIDYKNDDTAPSAMAQTANVVFLNPDYSIGN